MKTSFPKPYSSPKQIVQILKSRGMLMEDEHKVESYLLNIGYHRLSAYIFPFYKSPKSNLILKEGTTFEQVLTLYRFDKKLRILLFNEIEKIEVAIRSVLANIGCQELGDRYWITKPEYFANEDKFNQTLAVLEKELASSKEDYIENFRRNYVENYPPAWMITEVLSFGNLNYIYSNIANNRLMKRISDYFGLKPQVFTSWLTVLANLRNMCCHHARVWNRDFMLNPAEPRKTSNAWIDTSLIDKKRIFYRLCIIRYFLSFVSPGNNFNEKIANLLARFPSVDIAAMGFCKDWQKDTLWK
ncbi:Abi family protein [Phocaeicola massiliensis]|uniref:Abi family protein n=1 Tax=Phocaeicola massiliensis TaxID=204516 RepID=UPI00234CAB44|nr:Abi family protein [Phocaeicola massiliensis]MDC7186753.1 Abi family protein [Bacteroidaceae bacterium UO.H1004]MDC7199087.1 Abi family protein [Phocaeicola massiliensis]